MQDHALSCKSLYLPAHSCGLRMQCQNAHHLPQSQPPLPNKPKKAHLLLREVRFAAVIGVKHANGGPCGTDGLPRLFFRHFHEVKGLSACSCEDHTDAAGRETQALADLRVRFLQDVPGLQHEAAPLVQLVPNAGHPPQVFLVNEP